MAAPMPLVAPAKIIWTGKISFSNTHNCSQAGRNRILPPLTRIVGL